MLVQVSLAVVSQCPGKRVRADHVVSRTGIVTFSNRRMRRAATRHDDGETKCPSHGSHGGAFRLLVLMAVGAGALAKLVLRHLLTPLLLD